MANERLEAKERCAYCDRVGYPAYSKPTCNLFRVENEVSWEKIREWYESPNHPSPSSKCPRYMIKRHFSYDPFTKKESVKKILDRYGLKKSEMAEEEMLVPIRILEELIRRAGML